MKKLSYLTQFAVLGFAAAACQGNQKITIDPASDVPADVTTDHIPSGHLSSASKACNGASPMSGIQRLSGNTLPHFCRDAGFATATQVNLASGSIAQYCTPVEDRFVSRCIEPGQY